MKSINNKKIIFIFTILVAFISGFCYGASKKMEDKPRNVILIGWDGTQRVHMLELLSDGQLPNLEKLIKEGYLVYTKVTTGATQTKPGWAEILTGYSAVRMKIMGNKDYMPIPKGYTVFERLKKYYGKNKITTIFIGGKINNIESRGPHEICVNCIARDPRTREKTFHWDRQLVTTNQTYDNKPLLWVHREGGPYFNSQKIMDLHITGLIEAKNVGREALAALEKFSEKPFFAFFHFEEPDEQGHIYGENSNEYSEGIKTADKWLGIIVNKLKALGIYDKTIIFVTTDHGFDEGGLEHQNAPDMFLVVNSKREIRDGDRKDITPTILEEYGIDLNTISPALDGKSLFVYEGH